MAASRAILDCDFDPVCVTMRITINKVDTNRPLYSCFNLYVSCKSYGSLNLFASTVSLGFLANLIVRSCNFTGKIYK